MLRKTITVVAVTGAAFTIDSGRATAFFPPIASGPQQVTVVPPPPSPLLVEPVPVEVPVMPAPPINIPPANPLVPPVPPPPFVPPVVPPIVTPPVCPPDPCHCSPPAPHSVPEPATMLSAALGLVTVAAWRRKRRVTD